MIRSDSLLDTCAFLYMVENALGIYMMGIHKMEEKKREKIVLRGFVRAVQKQFVY